MLIVLTVNFSALAGVDTYSIDNTHSFASFTIRHVVSKTTGVFSDIKGTILVDRSDLSKSSIEAKINVMSVNTSHFKRDAHIREKAEYLDAEKFGWINFVSTKIEVSTKEEGILTGNLTLHGVTKEIFFPFKILGFGYDPWGGQRAGFEAHTVIKASDYGFAWGSQPKGPIGDDIEITLLIEGIKISPDFKPW
jgi:polyisoprenoid-binding protein YceI